MVATDSFYHLLSACKCPSNLRFTTFINDHHLSPYYVWLGRPRTCDVTRSCHAFEIEGGNTIGNCSPVPYKAIKDLETVPPLEIGTPILDLPPNLDVDEKALIIDVRPPLSSFHYQLKKVSF